MPWSFCSIATRAHALEYIYAQSDESLCPGLVPHAYKMSKMNKKLKLHSHVELSKKLSRE